MNPFFRRIIFIVFVFSFFATAGIVTFYTLGYRYSLSRGIFIYTGSVTVQANPTNVSIAIDKKISNANINQLNGSYHITGLQPGEHFIEVSADGYNTWSKKFIVNSGISTEFWNIMLTKNAYQETDYSTQPIQRAFPSPKSTLLAYVSPHENGFSVNTLDTKTGENNTIFETQDSTFDSEDKENIEWSIDADFVSVPLHKDGVKNYIIINSNKKETLNVGEMAQLNDLRMVRWDSSRNTFLLALSGNTLYEIDIENPSEKREIAQNVQSYDISGNDIYVLETFPSNAVYKTSLDNIDTHTQITTLPNQNTSDFRYSIIAYDQNRIVLINYYTGKLFFYNKNIGEISTFEVQSNAKGTQFSDDGKKFLYWTDREMFVYFTRDWETQPMRPENTTLTVGRFSQDINNIHWGTDYEHVTFSVGNIIKLIELDTRGEKSIMDIKTLPNQPMQIISNFDQSMLFYTTGQTNNQSLHSIDFPEKTPGIFGVRQ